MKIMKIIILIFILEGCYIQVKESEGNKKILNIVEKDEIDEYEMMNMDAKKLDPVSKSKLEKFLLIQVPDPMTETEKRSTMKMQIARKNDLLSKIENIENLKTKDYLKLLPKIKVEQRPIDTYDREGYPITKTESFYAFEVDLSKAFDLFDVSGNRKVEKLKARKKIKTLYFEIKRLVEKKAYYSDLIVRYEQQLYSKDIYEQKEARDQLPKLKMLKNDTDIIIAEKELEQEFCVLELEK